MMQQKTHMSQFSLVNQKHAEQPAQSQSQIDDSYELFLFSKSKMLMNQLERLAN